MPSETEVMYQELNRLFSNIRAADTHLRHNIKRKTSLVCKYKSRGLTYFPTNSPRDYELHGRAVSVHNVRQLLQEYYPAIDQYWNRYETCIAKMLNIDKSELENHGHLVFLRYSSKTGMWLHLDNLLRSDSTTFTIGIGRNHCVYDFAPTLLHRYTKEPLSSLRTTFPNGSLCAMDGEARYQWSHGVPYGMEGIKFTIIFKLQHLEHRKKNLGTEPTINCCMYTM